MKNNKSNDIKNAKSRICLDTIVEIAVRNNVSNLTVRNIYTGLNEECIKDAIKEREGKKTNYYNLN